MVVGSMEVTVLAGARTVETTVLMEETT